MKPSQRPKVIEYDWAPEPDVREYFAILPIDFFAVSAVHNYLEENSEQFTITPMDSIQLHLLCDELISNALLATQEKAFCKHYYILVRVRLEKLKATIIVFDYGGGIDLAEVAREIPQGANKEEYMKKLDIYRHKTALHASVDGKKFKHKRFGKGLKIICDLSDILDINFHNDQGVITPILDEDTVGTVISAVYVYKSVPFHNR